jgi:hypothetical protein
MTDLVERHKPREGNTTRTSRVRKTGGPITKPARREREDSPQGADDIKDALVDQRVG